MATGTDDPEDRVPQQALECEQAVLGAMLVERQAIDQAITILKPSDFYRPAHQCLFETFVEMYRRDEPVDILTVRNVLTRLGKVEEVGGMPYVVNLTDVLPSAANVRAYALVVKEKSYLRGLYDAGTKLRSMSHEEYTEIEDHLAKAQALVDEYTTVADSRTALYVPMQEVVQDTLSWMEEAVEGNVSHGIATGFAFLDRTLGRMKKGQLILLAALPGVGKSALAANIADNVAASGTGNVLFISLEMLRREIGTRMIAARVRKDVSHPSKQTIEQDDWELIGDHCAKLSELPIFISDRSHLQPTMLRSLLRSMKKRGETALIVVDYLQLAEPDKSKGSDTSDVAEVARQFKKIAIEFQVPILAMCAMNRDFEKRAKGEPQLSDLRFAGERDADTVVFLWNEHIAKDEEGRDTSTDMRMMNWKVAKNRAYRTGRGKLAYHPTWTRFDSVQEEQ